MCSSRGPGFACAFSRSFSLRLNYANSYRNGQTNSSWLQGTGSDLAPAFGPREILGNVVDRRLRMWVASRATHY